MKPNMPCKFLHIKPQMIQEIIEHPECCVDYHKIPLKKYDCMYYWDKSFKECKYWRIGSTDV